MADSPLNDLNYGRPGLTTYDLDNREWTISREPSSTVLQQVSEWQLVVPAALSSIPTQSSTNAATTPRDARRLAHNHPQLVPAVKDLPDLNSISTAIVSAAATYDPHVGDLLSFGTVHLGKSVSPKRIAALPTGPSGSILRLIPLGQQRNGWEGDSSVWLQGPYFQTVDSGYWNEEAAPIQQVVFGQAETRDSFLAVRLPSRTALFRPSYHRGRRAAQPSPHYDLPPSLLSAHPILNITIDQTGGVPHADVVFNPDYQFQFGIVDQQGTWSLWQIERRAKRDEYSATRLVGGRILPDTAEEVADVGDGWARILWAGHSNTIVVCNRRQLSLINVTGETFEQIQAPLLVPQRSSDWILDIKQHTETCFFVLTSTRLFLISMITSSDAVDGASSEAGATILLSRRHYRGDEDLTLQIHPQVFENQTVIFVTSRLNNMIQVYHLHDSPSRQLECVSITDPAILRFDLPAVARIRQMHLRSLEYGTKGLRPHRTRNASAQSYHERAIPFHQLTVFTADLGIHQTVLVSSKHELEPERLAWRRIVMVKHSLNARNDVDELGDFTEPNGPDWDAEPEPKLKSQVPREVSSQGAAHAKADHAWLYESLLGDQTASASIYDIIQQFRDMLSVESAGFDKNLMEPLEAVDVPDIDEASGRVQQLFVSQSTNVLRPIASQQVLRLSEIEQSSISSIYDTIIENWIASLPAHISVLVRQSKERLARRIAAEVTLASTQLRPRDEEQFAARSSDPASLLILPSKPADTLPLSLPTPPQSSVPPSSPLFPEAPRSRTSDLLSRLRKHLVINDDSNMTPDVLAPSVSELLSHWQPGTDPGAYDWEATERAIRPEAADEESQELREKERKRKARRDKRQRREDELMRAKAQTGSQPTFAQPAFPRSSPGPTFSGLAASSQVPVPISSQVPSQIYGQGGNFGGFGGLNSMVPQSQVEPGRFGGRPDKKKKGKSRVSGF